MLLNRFSPYQFANGVIARNRIVVPPMASQTATADGHVTGQTVAHYKRLSAAGAAIVFVEYTFVHRSGRGEANQLGADDDSKIAGLQSVAQTIQASGALAGLQLVHVGGKTTTTTTGQTPQAPSRIPVPVKGWDPDLPRAMSLEDIQNWKMWFLAATDRAVAAGFDLVELHAAHGYGLNQWLSPLTNQRVDQYGGTLAGRSLLLLEIVQTIKQKHRSLTLAVRIPAQDHFPGGLTLDEMHFVVDQLRLYGVNLIDVSSGIGGWRRPEGHRGEGYLVPDATQIKTQTTLPVIGVGGIESSEYIDKILSLGYVDFAAVGRAILTDPLNWQCRLLNQSAQKSYRQTCA